MQQLCYEYRRIFLIWSNSLNRQALARTLSVDFHWNKKGIENKCKTNFKEKSASLLTFLGIVQKLCMPNTLQLFYACEKKKTAKCQFNTKHSNFPPFLSYLFEVVSFFNPIAPRRPSPHPSVTFEVDFKCLANVNRGSRAFEFVSSKLKPHTINKA